MPIFIVINSCKFDVIAKSLL